MIKCGRHCPSVGKTQQLNHINIKPTWKPNNMIFTYIWQTYQNYTVSKWLALTIQKPQEFQV
jgi:hypothetical protein